MHKKLLCTFAHLAFVASVSQIAAMDDMSMNERISKCEKAIFRHAEINDIARLSGGQSEPMLYNAISNMSRLDYIDYVALVEGKSDPSTAQINNYINETYKINKDYNRAKHRWPQ